MLDRLLGKGKERERKSTDLRSEWHKAGCRPWVFSCQKLNTQRLIFKGVDGV